MLKAKNEWGPGPWKEEPDLLIWETKVGLTAVAKRNSLMGSWLGYVMVPLAHPLHGRDYHEVEGDLEVHGGVTYSGVGSHLDGAHLNRFPGAWWFGFDCIHCDDLAPDIHPPLRIPGAVYRTLEYVKGECESLAAQLKKLEET